MPALGAALGLTPRRRSRLIALGRVDERIADLIAHLLERRPSELRGTPLRHVECLGQLHVRKAFDLTLDEDKAFAFWKICPSPQEGVTKLEVLDRISRFFDQVHDWPRLPTLLGSDGGVKREGPVGIYPVEAFVLDCELAARSFRHQGTLISCQMIEATKLVSDLSENPGARKSPEGTFARPEPLRFHRTTWIPITRCLGKALERCALEVR
jgi:hypothetical protein